MRAKSNKKIKQNLLDEMNYLSGMGRYVGRIYPFIGKSKKEFLYFGFVFFLLFLTAAQLFTTICLNGTSDFLEIFNVAPNLGVVMMAILKLSTIHIYRELYDEIFCHFSHDFFGVVSDNNEKHKKIITKYTRIIKLVSRFVTYNSLPLIIVVDSFPRLIMYYEHDILGEELVHLYPFDGWYPFDKVNWYYTIYLWESFMTCVVIFIYGFCNIIHAAYTALICMELEILGNHLENLITANDVKNITRGRNAQKTHENIKSKLKNIMDRHQFLARIAKELDNALGDIMLLYYIFGAIIICLAMFTAIAVDDLNKTVRYFFMCCYLLWEVFFQCVNGQILSDHSLELSTAIYSADWIYADKDTKTMLHMLMARAQKPFLYTAKGYTTMNLNSFSGICKISYNLFNLLRTAYT